MVIQIVYCKGSSFILYIKSDDEYIVKVTNFREKEKILSLKYHINLALPLKYGYLSDFPELNNILNDKLMYLENGIISKNSEWLEKLKDEVDKGNKTYLIYEKLYSNIFKHPNNINVIGTSKIINIDYSTCLMIKLSFLFQIIMTLYFLNVELGICHGDLSFRNIWFKETSDEIIDYSLKFERANIQIFSYGFLVQIGDFGEIFHVGRDKCNDLLFVIKPLIEEIKQYNTLSNNFSMLDNEKFDQFLLEFVTIYNNYDNILTDRDYKSLLSSIIFRNILL